jgi:hypothetical protein
MPRPTIGKRPLTNAEKQARYRERKKAEGLKRRDAWTGEDQRQAEPPPSAVQEPANPASDTPTIPPHARKFGGICRRLPDVAAAFKSFFDDLRKLEYRHSTDREDIYDLAQEAEAALSLFMSGNAPDKDAPTYAQLVCALDLLKATHAEAYKVRDEKIERARIEIPLKDAVTLLETDAQGKIARMLKPWKITELQAALFLDRRTIQKLKKLKAFY